MSKAVFAMMAAGTVVSAYSAYQQGKMQRDLNNYNAQMAENNKILADQKYALDLKEHQKRYRHLLGKQRVSYAKSGVAIEGSAIDIIEEEDPDVFIGYNIGICSRFFCKNSPAS